MSTDFPKVTVKEFWVIELPNGKFFRRNYGDGDLVPHSTHAGAVATVNGFLSKAHEAGIAADRTMYPIHRVVSTTTQVLTD